jgi:hypothetical protein
MTSTKKQSQVAIAIGPEKYIWFIDNLRDKIGFKLERLEEEGFKHERHVKSRNSLYEELVALKVKIRKESPSVSEVQNEFDRIDKEFEALESEWWRGE